MMVFFLGIATGAVLALISVFYIRKANTCTEPEKALSEDEKRLNAEKQRRAERLKELDRQFDNMMNYHGKEQKA